MTQVFPLHPAAQVYSTVAFAISIMLEAVRHVHSASEMSYRPLEQKKVVDIQPLPLEKELEQLPESSCKKREAPPVETSILIEKCKMFERESLHARGKYEQLKQQFYEQKEVVHALRKELFIVQNREMSLSNRLKEHQNSSLSASLNELSFAFDATTENFEREEEYEALFKLYEDLIEKLVTEQDD